MKKNNSIIISILCGVTVCFLCLGIVFLLPAKSKKEMQGNISNKPVEVNLGDVNGNCMQDCLMQGNSEAQCTSRCTNPSGTEYCCCDITNGNYTNCTIRTSCVDGASFGYSSDAASCATHNSPDGGDDPSGGGGGGGDNPSSGGCDTAPCCINGTTVTNASVCMETSSATCGSCPLPTINCFEASGSSCSARSGQWGSCSSKGYYDTISECARHISCSSGQFANTVRGVCSSCNGGTTYNNCGSGTFDTCCVTSSSPESPGESQSDKPIADNCNYTTKEDCDRIEGRECKYNEEKQCYVARSARARFYDSDGAGILATCYTDSNGYLTSSCDPCCSKYTLAPRDNSTLLDKSYIMGRYFENSTSYYCATDYDTDCNAENTTPTVTAPPVIPKCYIDENNEYHWTSSPQDSWIIATKDGNEITNSNLCPPAPACYTDTKGNYVWGEYSAKPGYIYHAELTDESACKNNDYKCYTNGDNYVWTDTPGEGYIEANISYQECAETPACYYIESTKQRTWGYFSKVNGYYKIIDEENNDIPYEQCINDACYKCNKNYYWGDFSDRDDCEVVPSVTDITKCNNEAVVPATGVTISSIIYSFVAILMAFGIGFIYYSTVIKKNEQ